MNPCERGLGPTFTARPGADPNRGAARDPWWVRA